MLSLLLLMPYSYWHTETHSLFSFLSFSANAVSVVLACFFYRHTRNFRTIRFSLFIFIELSLCVPRSIFIFIVYIFYVYYYFCKRLMYSSFFFFSLVHSLARAHTFIFVTWKWLHESKTEFRRQRWHTKIKWIVQYAGAIIVSFIHLYLTAFVCSPNIFAGISMRCGEGFSCFLFIFIDTNGHKLIDTFFEWFMHAIRILSSQYTRRSFRSSVFTFSPVPCVCCRIIWAICCL